MANHRVDCGSSRDRKRRENHDRLFSAAVSEFDRVGYDNARIEHICKKSSVTRPTFYAHFSSKEGVLSELQLRHFQIVSTGMSRRTNTPLDLESMLGALVESCFEASSSVSERLRREICAYLPRCQTMSDYEDTELFAILVHGFDRSRRRGEIQGYNPRDLASDVMTLINGCLMADPSNLDSAYGAARRMLKLYVEGLRQRGRSIPVPLQKRGAA